jgi:hypothetical protein
MADGTLEPAGDCGRARGDRYGRNAVLEVWNAPAEVGVAVTALALLASLTLTAPLTMPGLPDGVTYGERRLTVCVARWRQSTIWRDLHVEMLRSPRLFRLLWPRVKVQARDERFDVRCVKCGPGERVTFENLPAGAWRAWVHDDRWNTSPLSDWCSVR